MGRQSKRVASQPRNSSKAPGSTATPVIAAAAVTPSNGLHREPFWQAPARPTPRRPGWQPGAIARPSRPRSSAATRGRSQAVWRMPWRARHRSARLTALRRATRQNARTASPHRETPDRGPTRRWRPARPGQTTAWHPPRTVHPPVSARPDPKPTRHPPCRRQRPPWRRPAQPGRTPGRPGRQAAQPKQRRQLWSNRAGCGHPDGSARPQGDIGPSHDDRRRHPRHDRHPMLGVEMRPWVADQPVERRGARRQQHGGAVGGHPGLELVGARDAIDATRAGGADPGAGRQRLIQCGGHGVAPATEPSAVRAGNQDGRALGERHRGDRGRYGRGRRRPHRATPAQQQRASQQTKNMSPREGRQAVRQASASCCARADGRQRAGSRVSS